MSFTQELFNKHKGETCFWQGIKAIVSGYDEQCGSLILGFEECNDSTWEHPDEQDVIYYKKPYYVYLAICDIISVVGGEDRIFNYPLKQIKDHVDSIVDTTSDLTKQDKIKVLSGIRDQIDGLLAELDE